MDHVAVWALDTYVVRLTERNVRKLLVFDMPEDVSRGRGAGEAGARASPDEGHDGQAGEQLSERDSDVHSEAPRLTEKSDPCV